MDGRLNCVRWKHWGRTEASGARDKGSRGRSEQSQKGRGDGLPVACLIGHATTLPALAGRRGAAVAADGPEGRLAGRVRVREDDLRDRAAVWAVKRAPEKSVRAASDAD
jgi:hypothetical protein